MLTAKSSEDDRVAGLELGADDYLINRIQGHDFKGYERIIDVHVKNLRKKIEADHRTPPYIETVHGL